MKTIPEIKAAYEDDVLDAVSRATRYVAHQKWAAQTLGVSEPWLSKYLAKNGDAVNRRRNS